MSDRILITGKNSYIGDSFAQYVSEKNSYTVDTVDMQSDEWENADFSLYDSVVHVAAIVHRKNKEVTQQMYFEVNSDLAFNVAKKAKDSGVKQFVFMSSMSVYGMNTGVISKDTKINPANYYAMSKADAEKRIQKLACENFTVTIVRPPMVYGKGCKGNYVTLANFAKKRPFFAQYKSQRSVIYIDNLSAFLKKAIDERLSGVFCPQDKNYISTSEMIRKIAEINGRKIRMTKIFNPFITLALKLKIGIFCKVFGTLIYDDSLAIEYDKIDFDTAIKKTES